jgi:NTP pyrophosphatase (non-canonical NTP hydrolase)
MNRMWKMGTTGNFGGRGSGRTVPLQTLFDIQKIYQKQVTGKDTPIDDLQNYSYHVQAMVEELGELMKADKRWKTHRNVAYDPQNKLEEIADCFITLINISLYSGFSCTQVGQAIFQKIRENMDKLRKAKEENK